MWLAGPRATARSLPVLFCFVHETDWQRRRRYSIQLPSLSRTSLLSRLVSLREAGEWGTNGTAGWLSMSMADAAIAPLPPGEAEGDDEDACRICHLPAEAGRPLRHPCACRGSIRFVHDDCLLRWLSTRRGFSSASSSSPRCEVRIVGASNFSVSYITRPWKRSVSHPGLGGF